VQKRLTIAVKLFIFNGDTRADVAMAHRRSTARMDCSHHKLPKATEKDIRENAARVIHETDKGVQTTIMSNDQKKVLAVVGLNGCRYLPNPDPDPMDEIMLLAMAAEKGKK
jgi:hypothetical protein